MPPGTRLGRIAEVLALARWLWIWRGAWGVNIRWLGETPRWMPRDFKALESVVKELVPSRSLVIMGRGSQFILKELSRSPFMCWW